MHDNNKILAIIQARMTSTRLPGKVIMPVLDKPLLGYELERIARAKNISRIVIATTTNASDDVIERYAKSLGFDVYRGSEHNVLERYYKAAVAFGAENIIRLTADCPLIEPEIIDLVINTFLNSDSDYASNILAPRTYPRGLDTEIFNFETLEKTWKEALLPPEQEHVTPYIYNHPNIFKLKAVYNNINLSQYRLTVDTQDDFTLIKLILENLYPDNSNFSLQDIINLISSNPALFIVNSHVQQKQ